MSSGVELDGVAEAVLGAKAVLGCPLCSCLSSEVPRFTLPCGHVFCATCTDSSLYKANECPRCHAFTRPKDASRTYCMDALIEAYCSFLDASPGLRSRVRAIEKQKEQERTALESDMVKKEVATSKTKKGIQSSQVKENASNSSPQALKHDRKNDGDAGDGGGRGMKRRVPDTYTSQHLDECKAGKRMVPDTYNGGEHDRFYLDSYEGSQQSFHYSDGTSPVEAHASVGTSYEPERMEKGKKKSVALVTDSYRFESKGADKGDDGEEEEEIEDDDMEVEMAVARDDADRGRVVKDAQATQAALVLEERKEDAILMAAKVVPDDAWQGKREVPDSEPLDVSPGSHVGRPFSQSSIVSAHSNASSGAGSTEKEVQRAHQLSDLIKRGLEGGDSVATGARTVPHRAQGAPLSLTAPQPVPEAIETTPPFVVWGSFESDVAEGIAFRGLLCSARDAGAITVLGDGSSDSMRASPRSTDRRLVYLCCSEMSLGIRRVRLTLPSLLAIAHGDDIVDVSWVGTAKGTAKRAGETAAGALAGSLAAYRVQAVRWRGVDHALPSPPSASGAESHSIEAPGIFHGLVFAITGEDADGMVSKGDVAGIVYANGGSLHVASEEEGATMTMTMTMTVDDSAGAEAGSRRPVRSAPGLDWKKVELCLDEQEAARREGEGVLDLTWLFLSLIKRRREPLDL